MTRLTHPLFRIHRITHGFEFLFHLSFSNVNCVSKPVWWKCYGDLNLSKGKYREKRPKKQKANKVDNF